MNDLLANLLQSAPDQRRLLGGWRDILDDIRDLCTSLNALPDHCACGDGVSHLRGSCICCTAPHAGRVPICADCGSLLAQLRPRIVTLATDTMRFFPVVRMLLQSAELAPAHAEGDQVERHIAAVMRTFERLVLEAGEFQEGCRASHLRVLKATAATLQMECDRFGARLEHTP